MVTKTQFWTSKYSQVYHRFDSDFSYNKPRPLLLCFKISGNSSFCWSSEDMKNWAPEIWASLQTTSSQAQFDSRASSPLKGLIIHRAKTWWWGERINIPQLNIQDMIRDVPGDHADYKYMSRRHVQTDHSVSRNSRGT